MNSILPDGSKFLTYLRANKLIYIKFLMLFMDVIAVLFVTVTTYITTKKIYIFHIAREFIQSVDALPDNPMSLIIISSVLLGALILSFILREFIWPTNNRFILLSIIFDFIISILIIFILDFNYNGILLWVFANLVSYTKGIKGRFLLIFLAVGTFLIADYELLSINYNLFSIDSYISYYDSTTQQYLTGIYNALVSTNIIVFIIYCINVIHEQSVTIKEVNILYEDLSRANDKLQQANIELQNYAAMKEKMGETKERNRLAREIHDTLGHTLTGISAGVDACIELVEKSPSAAKKQLQIIAQVVRQGILDVRRSVNELRPDALNRLGLEFSITKMISKVSSVTNADVVFSCSVKHLKFDEDEENAIYRVIQESLTNAIRHGKASKIWINLERENDTLILIIKDNGIGCTKMKSGFGTKHIIERIKLLNGTVEFDGTEGFSVKVSIPIRWGEEYD